MLYMSLDLVHDVWCGHDCLEDAPWSGQGTLLLSHIIEM